MRASNSESILAAGGARQCRTVNLAHSTSFRLGAVLVEPSRLSISRRGFERQHVEPRAMQVLSVLHDAAGAVVGRDDLIESCWSGRIVGDNSINRVISLLRRFSERIGRDSFEIETIPKVGYRLKESRSRYRLAPVSLPARVDDTYSSPPAMSRRTMLGGIAAAGAAIAAPISIATWQEESLLGFGGHVPTPEARQLHDAGLQAQHFGLSATSEQAEIYFRRAAQADPQWADAWGSLALSYRLMMDGNSNAKQWQLVEQARAAANRALQIDPRNAEALVALTLLRSPIGRWLDAEREYAALLRRFPDSFVLRSHYGRVLRDLGRFEEAVRQSTIAITAQPLIPQLSMDHLAALWGAGRMQEAEAEAERGFRLFAKHYGIWVMRASFLTYNRRAGEAVGLALDEEGWPADQPAFLFGRRKLTAQAVLTTAPKDIDSALRAIDAYIERCLSAHPFAIDPCWPVPFLNAAGKVDRAFEILESYYLWRGPLAPPEPGAKGPLSRRDTSLLFMPTLARIRRDPRFAALVEDIGLTAQFRESRKWPDSWPAPL